MVIAERYQTEQHETFQLHHVLLSLLTLPADGQPAAHPERQTTTKVEADVPEYAIYESDGDDRPAQRTSEDVDTSESELKAVQIAQQYGF